MSWDLCVWWDEEKNKCGKGYKSCRMSHNDDDGNCDGWIFDEREPKEKEKEVE